ncbi:MAG: M61 family peptidase [Stagnimonas sp.]|nr:M61 family peptidase [Stagnimonas sp.]
MDASHPAVQVVVSPDPLTHQFHVVVSLDAPQDCVFRLPNWIRGSYLVRDFAKHVSALAAEREGAALAIERLDKSSFRVLAPAGAVTLRYSVYAYDESVRKAFIDTRRGFFNASSLVYCPAGFEQSAFALRVEKPALAAAQDWQLATALNAVDADASGFGAYRAANYETLIDSPVEMAAFQRIDFVARDVPHTLTLSGRCEVDRARLVQDLTRICSAQREMFGDEPAMPRYWFLTHVTANSYGGLEHRESTALVCARADLPRPGTTGLSREYRTFLGLCSHEYFHLWNVKRITPQGFAGSDLQAAGYSRDLWHYEGVTSYYDDLFLLRAGVIDAPSYLDLVAEAATRLERTPARLAHTLADASFETWIKYYQPDENSPNASTNYYVKGALVALCLDLILRRDSIATLDDVLRALWQRYGRVDVPAPEGALEAVAAELSSLDLKPFFDAALRGTAELALAETLADFGVLAQRRVATGDSDGGGRNTAVPLRCTLGCKLKADGSVAHVITGSPAQQAGLAGGDVLIALDGFNISAGNFARRLNALAPGVPVELFWFRSDELMRAQITPQAAAADTWTLTLMDTLNATMAARRQAWLNV